MRSKLLLLLLSGVALILCSCTTAPEATPVATRSLSELRTFAFGPSDIQNPADDPAAASRLSGPAREAIVETLTAKGFKEVSPDQADFLIEVQTEFRPDGLTQASQRRSMRIDFVDRENNAVIWSNQRGRSSSSTFDAAAMRQTIIGMLEKVPTVGR